MALEIIRTIILAGIFAFFLRLGKNQQVLKQKGWNWILTGFFLLFLGSLVDITDEFESLSFFWFLGMTPAEAIVEKIIGFTMGSIFLSIGFVRWTPVILKTFKMEEKLKESNRKLEDKVDERTVELENSIQLLRESEEKFKSIFNKSSILSLILSNTGVIQEVNSAVTEFINEDRESLINKSVYETRICTDPENLQINIASAIKNSRENRYHQFELSLYNNSGDERVYEFTLSPLRDTNEQAMILIMTGFDITERKNITNLLSEAKDAADSANRAKSEFIARVSHELRTPMNSILGMTHLLKTTEEKDRQLEIITKIDTATHSLLNLINDIIEFSEIETGLLGLNNVQFNLKKTLSSLFMKYAKSAKDKNLELKVFTSGGVRVRLVGVEVYLNRIIDTVLCNAVKFTERGSTTVEVSGNSTENGKYNLKLDISDTGIGIDETRLSTIFASFTQEEDTKTRKYGGLGLGLTICHKLVTLLNGTMEVNSIKNKGSRFHIEIPFTISDESAELESFNFDNTGEKNITEVLQVKTEIPDNFQLTNSLSEYLDKLDNALSNYDAESFTLLNIVKSETGITQELQEMDEHLSKYDFDSARKVLEKLKNKNQE